LLMRRWRPADLQPFARLNADPQVMEFFPATLSVEESEARIARIEAGFEDLGYGPWALELPGEADFIGFTGLAPVDEALPFAPAVELAWRLDRPFWGRGLATEAASAAARFGFEELALRELVAYTAAGNERSRRVMERLGMERDQREDFLHPAVHARHPIAPHVIYRLDSERWRISSTHVRAIHQHGRCPGTQ
jgi:ribosomal-protein-alanine N-acetyltransferase